VSTGSNSSKPVAKAPTFSGGTPGTSWSLPKQPSRNCTVPTRCAGSIGWHWTDNLKTEIDFGGGTDSRVFRTQPVTIAGRSTYQTTQSRFKRQTLGFSQQYQFFHNVWFHPHVAAGVNVTWVRQRDEPEQIYFYDPATGTSRIEPRQAGTEQKSVTANPFVAIGYKAYLSDRAFFRNDLRLAFRGGIDETTLRIGLGFDF